jgi:thiamine-phosphate pyrophosphorylase
MPSDIDHVDNHICSAQHACTADVIHPSHAIQPACASRFAHTSRSDFPFRLYLVISAGDCLGRDFIDVARQAIEGGVDIVQLREKDATDALFLERALRLQEMLVRYNIPLIINDNLDVAMRCGAYGIHVGASDISPTEIRTQWSDCQSIGYSIEHLAQLDTDAARAADCFGISPVFSTPSKTNTVTEWGLDGIARIRALTTKPLIAIGSMNAGNACGVIRTGADCIAVISAICAATDPARAAFEIRNQIEKAL